jgi:16S rRNA A1518/A1519 N6-dimethyltransferase RsmA/KsgA/DIM1 with predicted DNA glycosylase/AP lyase activity
LLACPQFSHNKEARGEVDDLLAKLGIDGACRAETLDVEQHLRLFATFSR